MSVITEKIIDILKSHPAKKIQIEQLKFELDHPSLVGEKELIDSLSIGIHKGDGGRKSGHISNKTMAIALQYQDVAQRMNTEVITDIMRELRSLEAEVERLELYISFLEDKKAAIIRLCYFEGRTLEQTAQETRMAKRTVVKYRTKALYELASMYSFIDTVKGKKQEGGDC